MLFVGMSLAVFLGSMLEAGGFRDLGLRLPLSVVLRWGAMVGPYPGISYEPISFVEPFRYVSAIFLHLGVIHVLLNLTFLFDFGRATEQRLGSSRFAIIFFVSGVAGYLLSDAWHMISGDWGVTAGASGALFGLAGATLANQFARRDPAYKQLLLHLGVFTLAMLVLNFSVNHAAHLGGLLAGAALGFAFHAERRPYRLDRAFGWVAALIVVTCIGSILLSHRSPLWQKARRAEQVMASGQQTSGPAPVL